MVNVKKIFELPGSSGTALLMVTSGKGLSGDLADLAVVVLDTDQKLMPHMPKGVMNSSRRYYSGIRCHTGVMILLLNEDGLLP